MKISSKMCWSKSFMPRLFKSRVLYQKFSLDFDFKAARHSFLMRMNLCGCGNGIFYRQLSVSSSKSAKNSLLELNISFDMCNFSLFVMKTHYQWVRLHSNHELIKCHRTQITNSLIISEFVCTQRSALHWVLRWNWFFVNFGESLKFGANFLYYWTYRQKNGFKTG